MESVYFGHLDQQKCPDYQDVLIFQVRLYDKAFRKCVDYAGVLIFRCSN